MVNLIIGICIALFLLAVGFVVLTQVQEIGALFAAFLAQPPALKAAWTVVVATPLIALVLAIWLAYRLIAQRKAAAALDRRLSGVRQDAAKLAQSQDGAEASVHRLVRTDPEESIGALQQRLSEAERFLQVQQSRNEMSGLEARIGDIRAQQQSLQERLAPALDKRRSIEQLFLELDTRQSDLGRTLTEIASGDDAVALEVRVKSLMDFLSQSHTRCDEIETASKTIANLKNDYIGLENRFAPFVAVDGGVASRVRDLNEAGQKLEMAIKAIQLTPEGALGERMQRLAEDKTRLEEGLAHLGSQFSKLAMLRKDIDGLFTNFDRTLDTVGNGSGANGPHDTDSRVQELWGYIKETQAHIDDIDRRMIEFGQLKTKLSELQSRLVPLEDRDRGVLKLIEQLRDARDKLVTKLRHIEQDDDGDLTERVRRFTESKRELEERVAVLADQFSKLATIRTDIAGLFEKLSTAISTSSAD